MLYLLYEIGSALKINVKNESNQNEAENFGVTGDIIVNSSVQSKEASKGTDEKGPMNKKRRLSKKYAG